MIKKMPPLRLSERAKKQLSILKKRTGVKSWNVLSRWALCESMAADNKLRVDKLESGNAIEIAWDVFGGEYVNVYTALLIAELTNGGLTISANRVNALCRAHVERGVGYMVNSKKVVY